MSLDLDRMLHDRLMRIEEKLDRVHDRLSDGSRRMDAIEVNCGKCENHESRIQRLESTNKKALAAWGLIVLVGTAIVSVGWELAKEWFMGKAK